MKKRLIVILSALMALIMAVGTLSGCALFVANEPISIVSVEKTDSDGVIDTYTITYSDGSTSTFFITNGVDGADGEDGVDGADGVDGKDGTNAVDIDIDDVFSKYLAIPGNENKTYDDFLMALGLNTDGNAVAINSVLSSTVRVYCEFVEDYSGTNDTALYLGAGVVYQMNTADDGYTYFLTNYHVIYDEKGVDEYKFPKNIVVYIYGSDRSPYKKTDSDYNPIKDDDGYTEFEYGELAIECEYVGGCPGADVAIIRGKTADVLSVNPDVKAVTFADKYYVGEPVFAVGNPDNEGMSVTQGIICTDSEYISLTVDGTSRTHRSMRIDAALYHGNSGGGLFNSSGQLIGLAHAGDVTDQNVNYGVPLDTVRYVAENHMYYHAQGATGVKAKKVILGVTVNTEKSKYVYDETTGYGGIVEELSVIEIGAGSISNQLGIEVGDVIKELIITRNGNSTTYHISRSYEIGDLLFSVRAGDKIAFNVSREGTDIKTDEYTILDNDLIIQE